MKTLRRVLADAVDSARNAPRNPGGYYLRLSRAAMACHFEVLLRPEDRAHIPHVTQALDEVDSLEQQMSVYRADSEITRLNATAAIRPVAVEERLYGLLSLARKIGLETGGAYDLTSGALIRCWGFLERKGRVPSERELTAARACSGWQNLVFDDDERTIFFRQPGVELNLGSIGKGFALDRVAELLSRAGLRDFIAHAGHSSVVARGDSNSGRGWDVDLRGGGKLTLIDEAMSTSGTGTQFFEECGRRYGHILDARTGRPAEREGRCTVVAAQTAVAETLSTAAFAMTTEEIRARYQHTPDICIILSRYNENGSEPPVVIGRPARWAEEERP